MSHPARIFKREAPLEFDGTEYQIPYRGPAPPAWASRSRPSSTPGARHPHLPRRHRAQEREAGGRDRRRLPAHLLGPPAGTSAFGESLAGVDFTTFDVAPSVTVIVGDDVSACRDMVKPFLALYVGGMGARGRNFYNDLACRYGFEGAAKEIQDLYLDGKKAEAAAAVPDELVDEVALVGPAERITERLELWKASPITTLIVNAMQPEAMDVVAAARLTLCLLDPDHPLTSNSLLAPDSPTDSAPPTLRNWPATRWSHP